MKNFDELREHIAENTKTVTMKEITNKTWDIWREMRDNEKTVLDGDFFIVQMLSWYIICCECDKIAPVSGY